MVIPSLFILAKNIILQFDYNCSIHTHTHASTHIYSCKYTYIPIVSEVAAKYLYSSNAAMDAHVSVY